MYEPHREGFSNRSADADDRSDEPARRWRRAEERYRREAQGSASDDRFDDERYEAQRRTRDFGYGRSADDRDQRGHGQRGYYGGARDQGHDDRPQVHWHEHDREQRAGHPYQGTYGGTGDSSYFTGQQGSWAVGEPRRPSPYYGGTQHFGADYRSHGYADRDDSRHDGQRGFWDRASDEVASWFGDEDAARRREQDHRGRGPADYTRSDERIREDANDRLTEDRRVDASKVTVTVDKGEVTLGGTVTSREAKRRAEDVVDDISGVKHVQNNLRVQTDTASGYGYTGNQATTGTSTAEGGTIGRSPTGTVRQNDKV